MRNARKTLTTSLAALTLGAAIAASASPAEARYGRNAAFFGGLAIGALALGAIASSQAYAAPSDCVLERRPVTDPWGNVVGFRRVRICY